MRLKDSEKLFNVVTRFLDENIHIDSTETRQKIIKDISGMNTIYDVYKYPIQNHYLSDYDTALEWVEMLFLLNFGGDRYGGTQKFDSEDLNVTECLKEISVLYDGAGDLYRDYLDDIRSDDDDESDSDSEEPIADVIMDAVESSVEKYMDAGFKKLTETLMKSLTEEVISVVKKTIRTELKGK